MNANQVGDPSEDNPPWPFCPALGGRCLLEEIGRALGKEILESLFTFILAPQPGSRLSLQRNQNEFTSQFTGPVARTAGTTPGLSDYQALRQNLSATN